MSVPSNFGKYRLLEQLARGGMAEVFRAKSYGVEGFEKTLVIKRILPELCRNSKFVDMFVNEAKIAVTLSHANIVQVFDLGREGDSYFIAMEYVPGFDLATVFAKGQQVGLPFPVDLAVLVALEIAKALDYAHRRLDEDEQPMHIVHRDVSPHNVLLSHEGDIKLTDFGIAKARTGVEEDMESGVLKGKYAYMAPEQANGREVDARADLFALGTVLYEAIAGWNPFSRDSSLESLKAVRRGEAPPLRQVNPDVPEGLSRIVSLAMSPGIESRHPSASLLCEDLQDFMLSEGTHVTGSTLRSYLQRLGEAEADGFPTAPPRISYTFSREAEPWLVDARRDEIAHEDAVVAAPSFTRTDRTGTVHAGADATPAEAPAAKSTARRDSSTGSGVRDGRLAGGESDEKREVTVLALLRPLFDQPPEETMRTMIRRFGGHVVEQTTAGDGRWIVVAFGATEPDGRDSDRAARCALRIARATDAPWNQGPEHTLRLAIHSGAAFVDQAGELVRDQSYNTLVLRAQKLAGQARDGEVLVSDASEKLLARRFLIRSQHGSHSLQGESSATPTEGSFVGRRAEMLQLGDVLSRADGGVGQLLMLVGEPGAGKSRILMETAQRLRDGAHQVGFYLVPISRLGRSHPFGCVEEFLRVFLGVDELDAPSTTRGRVDGLGRLGLSRGELQCLSAVLGVAPLNPPQGVGNHVLRQALSRLLRAVAESGLAVVAFDGVEGIDEESRNIWLNVIRDCADVRVAWLMTLRPGIAHAWSELPGYNSMNIGPLPERDGAALMNVFLGADEVPRDLLRDVMTRGRGNPLFMEEILHSLEESGALKRTGGEVEYSADAGMTVALPRSLQGMMEARLGRLAPLQRHLLQVAAVIGTRFSASILAAVTGEDEERVAQELVPLTSRGILTEEAADEFQFTHELVAGVLVDGLSEHTRQALHRTVARVLEEQFPKQLEELRPRLALHWEGAGDPRRAIEHLERSADRLEAERRFRGAMRHLRQAAELARGCAHLEREIPLALYRRFGDLALRCRQVEVGAEVMKEALEFAESIGRDAYVARFSMLVGRCLGRSGSVQEGQPFLFRAHAQAEDLGNQELLRDVELASAEALSWQGRFADAVRSLQRALALAEDGFDTSNQLRCLMYLAEAESVVNGPGTALELLSMAHDLAEPNPEPRTLAELRWIEATIYGHAAQYDEAVAAATEALHLAQDAGLECETAQVSCLLGELEIWRGDQQSAFPLLRQAFELARENGYGRLQLESLKLLGFIDAARFRSKDGKARIEQAVHHARAKGQVWDQMHGLFFLALAESSTGRTREAEALLNEAISLAASHRARTFQHKAQVALRSLKEDQAPSPRPAPLAQN